MNQATSINPAQRGESSALEGWQAAGKWFNYGEQTIFSRIEGRGEALLLLHGFPTSSWDWHRLWPRLLPHHQVMALDMVGFGFSDKPADYDYSIVDQATLHQGWLQTLDVERVHIIAHDYGTSVAQELLAREQEGALECEIASVSFLNGALFPEMHRPMLIQKLLVSPAGGLVSRAITRQVFEYNISRIFGPETRPTRQDLEDFWQLLIYNNGRGILHRLIRYLEERRCHRNRWVGALQRAKQPLQLISGQADPVSGKPMADRFASLLPNAQLTRLDRIGHYPHFEYPGAVWKAYSAFRDL